jgi:colanic acid/amylovoran biosynthesis protein
VVLAGAAIGNGNRGVEALGRSVADAIQRESPGSRLTILDDGWGRRPDSSGRYPDADVEYLGVRLSRRWHRPESWAQIRLAQRFAPQLNPAARRFADADAILDISAGDSFTDLYGPTRLASVSEPKEAALRAGRPLILLPQTYGPFTTQDGRRKAERLVRASAIAYARDEWSHTQLLELAGPDADTSRLRRGVDVAFALEPREPDSGTVRSLAALEGEVLAGVNVSGLLRDRSGHERFGLAGDYIETMTSLVRQLIKDGAHVVFVPHVHLPGGAGESDVAGIEAVRAGLDEAEVARTSTVPPTLDAAELKWCISRMDWFVGSRMHSTIGSLSTGTPTFGYAYSDKTQGVFDSCSMGAQVADARRVAGAEAVAAMAESFTSRSRLREELTRTMPPVVDESQRQLRDALTAVAGWSKSDAVNVIA